MCRCLDEGGDDGLFKSTYFSTIVVDRTRAKRKADDRPGYS